jgi:menaquinone-specific isochorismate synthase
MARGESAALRLVARGGELSRVESLVEEIERLIEGLREPFVLSERRVREARVEGREHDSQSVLRLRAAEPALHPSNGTKREMDVAAWNALVTAALGEIRAGHLDKVVAARRSHVEFADRIDPSSVLDRLRVAEPACARFAFEREGRWFVGATPECLVRRSGRNVAADALAGSIARRDSDDESCRALLASIKDRHEHSIVATAVIETLARFGANVSAPATPGVRSLRHVHHLWTPVSATLDVDSHVLDLVSALHPTPAVCGTPPRAAATWIDAHEPTARGWYASPVGWFDGRGDGTFAVAIRSALLDAREAWLFAGAGIVAGSEPASEYRETSVKLRSMLSALGVGP